MTEQQPEASGFRNLNRGPGSGSRWLPAVDSKFVDTQAQRELFRGSLEVLVLAALAEGPQYGYGLQKKVQQACGQAIPPGTLYPLLHRLELNDCITSRTETVRGRQRKWYTLTDRGRQRFRAAAAAWQSNLARMQALVLPSLRQVANPR